MTKALEIQSVWRRLLQSKNRHGRAGLCPWDVPHIEVEPRKPLQIFDAIVCDSQ
jgi:hypothetical protein